MPRLIVSRRRTIKVPEFPLNMAASSVLKSIIRDLAKFGRVPMSGLGGHGERRLCVSGASHANFASTGGSGNEECF